MKLKNKIQGRRLNCWSVKLKKKMYSIKKLPRKINKVNPGQPAIPATRIMRSR